MKIVYGFVKMMLNSVNEFRQLSKLIYTPQISVLAIQKNCNLLEAMELACDDTGEEMCQGWIRHTRVFFPRFLARANIE